MLICGSTSNSCLWRRRAVVKQPTLTLATYTPHLGFSTESRPGLPRKPHSSRALHPTLKFSTANQTSTCLHQKQPPWPRRSSRRRRGTERSSEPCRGASRAKRRTPPRRRASLSTTSAPRSSTSSRRGRKRSCGYSRATPRTPTKPQTSTTPPHNPNPNPRPQQ